MKNKGEQESVRNRPSLMLQRAELLKEQSKTAAPEDAQEMKRIAANLRVLAQMRSNEAAKAVR